VNARKRATVRLPELALVSILVQLGFRTGDAFGVRNRVKMFNVPGSDKSRWQSYTLSLLLSFLLDASLLLLLFEPYPLLFFLFFASALKLLLLLSLLSLLFFGGFCPFLLRLLLLLSFFFRISLGYGEDLLILWELSKC